MADLAGHVGFALEATSVRAISGQLVAKHLESDDLTRLLVRRPEKPAHCPLADRLGEPVRAHVIALCERPRHRRLV